MSQDRSEILASRSDRLVFSGTPLEKGTEAPEFIAVGHRFDSIRLTDSRGKVLIITGVMSVDIPVCETIIRRFDRSEKLWFSLQHGRIEVWSISMDLPFSLSRFREIADVKYVKTMSDFRERSFGSRYSALLSDPFAGVIGRTAFVIGDKGTLEYVQYLETTKDEPDYEKIIEAAQIALPKDGGA